MGDGVPSGEYVWKRCGTCLIFMTRSTFSDLCPFCLVISHLRNHLWVRWELEDSWQGEGCGRVIWCRVLEDPWSSWSCWVLQCSVEPRRGVHYDQEIEQLLLSLLFYSSMGKELIFELSLSSTGVMGKVAFVTGLHVNSSCFQQSVTLCRAGISQLSISALRRHLQAIMR